MVIRPLQYHPYRRGLGDGAHVTYGGYAPTHVWAGAQGVWAHLEISVNELGLHGSPLQDWMVIRLPQRHPHCCPPGSRGVSGDAEEYNAALLRYRQMTP